MNKTIIVFSSARRNGNTGKLVDWIASRLNIKVIDLATRNISPYDYEHSNLDDDFLPVLDYLLTHDNIIFASPVYWYAMTPQMKAFLDRFSDFLDLEHLKDRGRKLRGKQAFLVATSIKHSLNHAFEDAFKLTFGYLGMEYQGHLHANCVDGFTPDRFTSDVDAFIQLLSHTADLAHVPSLNPG